MAKAISDSDIVYRFFPTAKSMNKLLRSSCFKRPDLFPVFVRIFRSRYQPESPGTTGPVRREFYQDVMTYVRIAGRDEEAQAIMEEIRTAEDLHPSKNRFLMLQMAMHHVSQGQQEEALKVLEGTNFSDHVHTAVRLMGAVLGGRLEEATDLLESAGEDPYALKALRQMFTATYRGNKEQAAAFLTGLMKREGNSAHVSAFVEHCQPILSEEGLLGSDVSCEKQEGEEEEGEGDGVEEESEELKQ